MNRYKMLMGRAHRRKPRLWIVAGLMAVSLGAAVSLGSGRNGDEEEIRALYDRVATAYSAKDVDALMQNYAPGDELFVFVLTGEGPLRGPAAYRLYCQKLFATLLNSMDKMEIRDLYVAAEGDLAYTRAIAATTLMEQDGSKASLALRVTGGLRKIQGKWLITQEHISVLRADAMTNLLRSRKAANEASAVGSLRTLNTACVTYSVTYGTGFPAKLSHLGGAGPAVATSANLIDEALASGTKNGYTFLYRAAAAVRGVSPAYTIQANPITPGQTGDRYFFTDQSGVIRVNTSRPATSADPPIS
jgi:uncharacterized protein (TIGR02246 family)